MFALPLKQSIPSVIGIIVHLLKHTAQVTVVCRSTVGRNTQRDEHLSGASDAVASAGTVLMMLRVVASKGYMISIIKTRQTTMLRPLGIEHPLKESIDTGY